MLELLVVVGVLILLLAILLPSLNAAREQARRMICKGNLREWGVANQMYRDDHHDYFPMEGHNASGIDKPGTWYNELPPYLNLPAYKDIDGANEAIEERPAMHVWICPSKNLTDAYKSGTGKNQFHYGMNYVLDGMGPPPEGSDDTPGFPNPVEARPLRASQFVREPYTVLLFDLAPNSTGGSPRDVATMYWRNPWEEGGAFGKFHGDYANFLYLGGAVGNFAAADIVTDNDFRYGDIIWTHPRLYWGYRPPVE